MSVEQNVYTILSGYAPLTALVGDRIYPYAIPQGAALPAVAYVRGATQPFSVLGGEIAISQMRVVVMVWDQGISDAEAAADQVVAAFAASAVPLADRSGTYDDEAGIYGVSIEVDWWE